MTKETNTKRAPRRAINGILLLDKPIQLTSNAALQKVKRLFCAKKAGHTGSLDPLATGLLPICFGEATKFSQFLLNADKRYYVRAKLGERTTTSDAEGEVIETRSVPEISMRKLEKILDDFRGDITQVPSMYSALKYQGKPLYEYARKGIEVPREPRHLSIYDLTVASLKDGYLEFSVHCSKGTYVRTLVDDIGERLGCGAHVVALRRLKVGAFHESLAVTLPQLEQWAETGLEALDKHILPVEKSLEDYPRVNVDSQTARYMRQGNPVIVPHAPSEGLLRIYNKSDVFLGIGEVQDDGRVAPRRLLR